jgi:hypothetical protein
VAAPGLLVLTDLATALSGIFNAGYFSRYWLQARHTRAKRIGAAALVAGGAAAAIEAAFSQGLFWFSDELLALGATAEAIWLLVRLPLLFATLFISGIVVRRMAA